MQINYISNLLYNKQMVGFLVRNNYYIMSLLYHDITTKYVLLHRIRIRPLYELYS